ncbi:Hypothetical predicted protein [Podarcis lilfordi]|uniref:Uncharacterized protein n=1 Tax=Podarcis lilfordi TaxID=74358 RepID=A0AA35P656_9SAUR|nr:Hypothetical predicted protein [Podarcis lilfordi]
MLEFLQPLSAYWKPVVDCFKPCQQKKPPRFEHRDSEVPWKLTRACSMKNSATEVIFWASSSHLGKLPFKQEARLPLITPLHISGTVSNEGGMIRASWKLPKISPPCALCNREVATLT